MRKLSLLLACVFAAPFFPVDARPSEVVITTEPGINVKVNRNKTNTSKQISVTINKDDKVLIQTFTQPVPPKPADETQQVACPAGSVAGSTWTQTRTYTLVNGAWVAGPWTPTTPPAGACPQIPPMPGNPVDPATVPAPRAGVLDDRISNPPQFPNPSNEGGFRTVCYYSHASNDDPIVYPGQKGASHHHTFYGNDATDFLSTPNSIANSGGSTCRGGTANRTSYWHPSMLEGDKFIAPLSMIIYYKNNPRLEQTFHPTYAAFPPGLRMIAGNSKAMSITDVSSAFFTCIDSATQTGPHSANIPACAPGNTIWMSVEFPSCWDGVNLDSPDHKSHVRYVQQLQQPPFTWSCPSTHPVLLPTITTNAQFAIPPGTDTTKWKLSSDMYSPTPGFGGYSNHSDWFNGWKPSINAAWIAGCNNAQKDCQAQMLGDGRVLDSFNGN